MRFYRCKCGKKTAWSSMGIHDCDGCESCGTTLAISFEFHQPLQAHVYQTYYDQNTGAPYERCVNCGQRKLMTDHADQDQ